MPMKAPPHPGLSVRLDCLEPIDLSVTEAAKALGVTRQALNDVVNGKPGFRRTWRFGSTRRLAAPLKPGWPCRRHLTWRRHASAPEGYPSSVSGHHEARIN